MVNICTLHHRCVGYNWNLFITVDVHSIIIPSIIDVWGYNMGICSSLYLGMGMVLIPSIIDVCMRP